MTPAQLVEVTRDAFAGAAGVPTAGHAGPAEVTATPAVIARPADPWLTPNRRIGSCVEARWTLQLLGARFDLPTSLDQLAAGYVAVVAALHAAGVGQIGPLGVVEPAEVAGTTVVAAAFAVTIPYDPGGPQWATTSTT